MGAPAKSFRMGLGALIIKEKLGISDRETVEHIRTNPYLQYFIYQLAYSNELPFDPSLLVLFRQRISSNLINKVNERRSQKCALPPQLKPKTNRIRTQKMSQSIGGKLIRDAPSVPADISYPTDLGLLNEARNYTKKIRYILYK